MINQRYPSGQRRLGRALPQTESNVCYEDYSDEKKGTDWVGVK